MATNSDQRRIIIFDGVCNFCNGAVNFIIRHDADAKFSFIPMQSEIAQELTGLYGINNVGVDTFLLIKDNQTYIWTTAALEIAKELDGHWYLFNVFKIIPAPIRDWFYRLFARNRYKLFGRADHCVVPTDEIRHRFLGA